MNENPENDSMLRVRRELDERLGPLPPATPDQAQAEANKAWWTRYKFLREFSGRKMEVVKK
jgi:hypothetical protein